MRRPRVEAEQKKVRFSLAFSPNLSVGLEKVCGATSQSVFAEEWLCQHLQIAAEGVAMNDPGCTPSVTHSSARWEAPLSSRLPSLSTGTVTRAR
jgi:hypothetical protein